MLFRMYDNLIPPVLQLDAKQHRTELQPCQNLLVKKKVP
jgi:hypothetical protein